MRNGKGYGVCTIPFEEVSKFPNVEIDSVEELEATCQPLIDDADKKKKWNTLFEHSMLDEHAHARTAKHSHMVNKENHRFQVTVEKPVKEGSTKILVDGSPASKIHCFAKALVDYTFNGDSCEDSEDNKLSAASGASGSTGDAGTESAKEKNVFSRLGSWFGKNKEGEDKGYKSNGDYADNEGSESSEGNERDESDDNRNDSNDSNGSNENSDESGNESGGGYKSDDKSAKKKEVFKAYKGRRARIYSKKGRYIVAGVSILKSKAKAREQTRHIDFKPHKRDRSGKRTNYAILIPLKVNGSLCVWEESQHTVQACKQAEDEGLKPHIKLSRVREILANNPNFTVGIDNSKKKRIPIGRNEMSVFVDNLVHGGAENEMEIDVHRLHIYITRDDIQPPENYTVVPRDIVWELTKDGSIAEDLFGLANDEQEEEAEAPPAKKTKTSASAKKPKKSVNASKAPLAPVTQKRGRGRPRKTD